MNEIELMHKEERILKEIINLRCELGRIRERRLKLAKARLAAQREKAKTVLEPSKPSRKKREKKSNLQILFEKAMKGKQHEISRS